MKWTYPDIIDFVKILFLDLAEQLGLGGFVRDSSTIISLHLKKKGCEKKVVKKKVNKGSKIAKLQMVKVCAKILKMKFWYSQNLEAFK